MGLSRGSRLVELLKQKNSDPLAVEQQVLLLFQGMEGYLDDLEIGQIGAYKAFCLDYAKASNIFLEFDPTAKLNKAVFAAFPMHVWLTSRKPYENNEHSNYCRSS